MATTVPSKHVSADVEMDCKKNGDDDGARVEGREPIGGGAINEKPRLYQHPSGCAGTKNHDMKDSSTAGSWNPRDNLSHMMHALVGLDRYPNYLSRFKDESDMDLLEHALGMQESLFLQYGQEEENKRYKQKPFARRRHICKVQCRK